MLNVTWEPTKLWTGGVYSTSAGSFPPVSQRQKSGLYQRWITVQQRTCSIKQLLKLINLVADSESGWQISEAEGERKSFSDASFTDEVQCSSRLQWGPGGECSCVGPPKQTQQKASRVYPGQLHSAFPSCSSNQSGTGPKTDSNWFQPNFINLVLLTFVDILTEQQSTGEGCKCWFDEDLIKSGEYVKLWVKLWVKLKQSGQSC